MIKIYTVKRGPIHLVNQFVGVWLAALTLIQSAQLFFTIRSSLASEKRWVRAVEFCYFLLFLIGSVVLLIGFGLALRGDGIGWSATLVLVNCANIVAFWLKRPGEFDQLASAPKPYTLSCLSWFLRFFLLIFLILLCNGSLLLGIGTVLYQPR